MQRKLLSYRQLQTFLSLEFINWEKQTASMELQVTIITMKIMILLKAVNSNYIFIITIMMMILALHAKSLITYWLAYLRNCCLKNKICIWIGGQIHKSSLDNCCLWVSWLFWEIECQPQGAALKCSYWWINRSIVFYSR